VSLRARLATVLAVTVLLPLLGVGVVVGVLVPRVAAESSQERLEVTARAASSALARQCTALGLAARSLALEVAPLLAAGEAPPAGAADAAVGGLDGATAAVLDADGRVLVASDGADLAGTGGLSCSRDDGTGSVDQVESVPVRDASGAPVGWAVARAGLDADWMDELRGRAGLPAALALADDGVVVAAGVAGSGVTRAQLEAISAEALEAPAGSRRTGEAAGLRYTVLGPVPGVPATVVSVEPARSSFLSWAVPLLLTTAALVALAGTVVLARRLASPLEELTDTVTRLGAGDLSTRSVVRGDDEVGRLATAVNAMADALEQSLADSAAGRDALADSLERFGEALARTHDIDGLLQTVAEAAASEAGADTCVVYVEDGHALVERAVVDLEVHSPPTRAHLLAAAREAVARGEEVGERGDNGISVVALPLLHGDRVRGAMVLAGRRRLEGEALAAARSLVRPAGTAVANVLIHEEAARLSVTDPLTGLANFRSLSETLVRETDRATRFERPLSVLMLDVDLFKTVNDSWGHAVGDIVLRDLAARLQGLVREVDTVARYGGEEFAIVLPETGVHGAAEVAQRVVEAVRREPFGLVGAGSPLRVTVSAGVATFPDCAATAAELMQRADQALYAAKAQGRDGWSAARSPGAGDGLAG
jgi:two-component system, cell cycle response regulator